MEVTLITMAYPYPRAGFWPGIERQVAGFAGGLRDAGVSVNVITSFRNGGPPEETHEGVRIFRVPDSVHRFGRIGYVMNMQVKSLGASAVRLTRVLDRSDVVESFIPLPASPALERKGLVLVAFFAHRDRPSRWSEYLIHPEHFRMERKFLPRVDRIIVASSESRRVLIEEYGVPQAKIEIVPLGVAPRFLDAAQERRPAGRRAGASMDNGSPWRLLYAGLMIPRKGLRTLIDALPMVRDAGLSFRLTMAGSGPDMEALKDRAARLGLGDLVEFPGRVEDEDLLDLYRDSDLFVFPSRKEGFGLVLVEAMACGLPVVASSVPPMPEVVGEAGLFFNPEEPADLAAALMRVLRERDTRERLAAAGPRRVRERFLWSRIAERTLEVYRKAGAP